MNRSRILASLVVAATLFGAMPASAQICPASSPNALPAQAGHPWTKLADCVSGGNAVVGGMVGQADCTYAYLGNSQNLNGARALGTITVANGGVLVFLDQAIDLEVGSITVQGGGTLQVGARDCPVAAPNQVRIFFTGGQGSTKGINVEADGKLRMWGLRGNAELGKTSWAHLAEPAGPVEYDAAGGVSSPVTGNAKTLVLDTEVLSWRPGDWIVVAGTDFAPDSADIVRIASKTVDPQTHTTRITTTQPLVNYHFGGPSPTCSGDADDPYCGPSAANYGDPAEKNYGVDERAEVALLSRSIRLISETPNPYAFPAKTLLTPAPAGLHWGAMIKVEEGFDTAEIAGVEMSKFGGDQDGQFPVYFTGNGKVTDNGRATPVLSSNSIHHSYNKCIALEGLTGATINDNVCTRIVGNMFYLRSGAEQGLRFLHNLGIGAMSNEFAVPSRVPVAPHAAWWPGDYLTNGPAGKCPSPQTSFDALTYNCYDGFGIPLTDPAGGQAIHLNSPYASSGFWMTNPANDLEGNSIAGCQAQGVGYWYNTIGRGGPVTYTLPLGKFRNNRVHGCYYGLTTAAQNASTTGNNANYSPRNDDDLDLIATFDGITATRNRYLGIWVRPGWYALTNSRIATNREGASLVSSGGIEGSAPGVWSLMDGAVFVGESRNNPGRFGPCPYDDSRAQPPADLLAPAGRATGVCAETPNDDRIGTGYPDAKWNEFGYMFYDGPARLQNSRFVNFNVDPKPNLTAFDVAYLHWYEQTKTMPCGSRLPFQYEGDAALGWFQANLQAYPPTQYTENISFENSDFRHQIYTEEVGQTCWGGGRPGAVFQDGDKNTVILDKDGTLSDYVVVDADGQPVPGKSPISLNNLPFLAVADTDNGVLNTVDEPYSEGAQDKAFENRPTAQMSPNEYATLEFSAVPCANSLGIAGRGCSNSNPLTFTKDQKDYGVHQSMTLDGRNHTGIYEPKVMDGLGYTVQAQRQMPPFVSATFADAPVAPFEIRLGITYQTPQGPLQCPNGDCSTVFRVSKGRKSLGAPGGGTANRAALLPYWKYYDVCSQLDSTYGTPAGYKFPNLLYCPYPELAPDNYSRPGSPDELLQVGSIEELTPSTYFYDQSKGLLFFLMRQEGVNGDPTFSPNGGGPSPLGSCTGAPGDDPSCPEFDEGESFYSCPAEGCELYMVEVLDTAGYAYDPDSLAQRSQPYPDYDLPYPANLRYLKNVNTGAVLTPANLKACGHPGSFPHLVEASATCPAPAISMSRTGARGTAEGRRLRGASVTRAAR